MLEFRKDNTYKFFNYSVFGGKNISGIYSIKDSIITLDKNEIENVIKTNTLAIRQKNNQFKEINYIVQIDKKHKRIEDDYFDFKINIDNR